MGNNYYTAKLRAPRIILRVIGWAMETFTHATPKSVAAHFPREADEFCRAVDGDGDPAEEAADCVILLLHHSELCGYDLFEEVEKKLDINIRRQWGEPDEQGVSEHIK